MTVVQGVGNLASSVSKPLENIVISCILLFVLRVNVQNSKCPGGEAEKIWLVISIVKNGIAQFDSLLPTLAPIIIIFSSLVYLMHSLQIQFLLNALGISQYKETFSEEGISGDILVECDDHVLEHDLGIKSRIHRIKLLTLILGKASVEMYL